MPLLVCWGTLTGLSMECGVWEKVGLPDRIFFEFLMFMLSLPSRDENDTRCPKGICWVSDPLDQSSLCIAHNNI